MRVKRPAEIRAGDRIWLWKPRGWLTVTHVDPRAYETAMLRLSDGRTVEAYTKRLIP